MAPQHTRRARPVPAQHEQRLAIDHLNLPVADLPRAVAFHEAALAPLRIRTVMAVPADPAARQKAMHAFGAGPKPFSWVIDAGRALPA